jgi:hypothetical protein
VSRDEVFALGGAAVFGGMCLFGIPALTAYPGGPDPAPFMLLGLLMMLGGVAAMVVVGLTDRKRQ